MGRKLRFFKKGRTYYKEEDRDGNFSLIDGKWYHQGEMDKFVEVEESDYIKSKGDKGVDDSDGAPSQEGARSAARKRLFTDVAGNDDKGEDGEGETGPADATGGDAS